MSAAESAYDALPYVSYAYYGTHPDNLATIARLFGLAPTAVEACRVLELGCAEGGNLLPMAAGLPRSRFLGLDSSERQIAEGRALVASLELDNLELRAADLTGVDTSLGEFDYILCHGVYSWVPDAVQARILEICRSNLAANGVAYLSYNVYPGWHEAESLRDTLRFHGDPQLPPAERVARARVLLGSLAGIASELGDSRSVFLANEHAKLSAMNDSYFFHEYLEGENRPVHFHELVARAESHGLRYLGNAMRASMFLENHPPVVAEALTGCRSMIEAQQYLDFFTNQRFRATLLCHAECRADLNLQPERVTPLFVRGTVAPDPAAPGADLAEAVEVVTPGEVGARLKTAAQRLAASLLRSVFPRAIPMTELLAAVRERLEGAAGEAPPSSPEAVTAFEHGLAADLTRLYFGNVLELSTRAVAVTERVGERPRASAVARLLAGRLDRVPNQWHESITLDAFHRALLALLDGHRDREALTGALLAAAERGELALGDGPPDLSTRVDEALARLRAKSFLVA